MFIYAATQGYPPRECVRINEIDNMYNSRKFAYIILHHTRFVLTYFLVYISAKNSYKLLT